MVVHPPNTPTTLPAGNREYSTHVHTHIDCQRYLAKARWPDYGYKNSRMCMVIVQPCMHSHALFDDIQQHYNGLLRSSQTDSSVTHLQWCDLGGLYVSHFVHTVHASIGGGC